MNSTAHVWNWPGTFCPTAIPAISTAPDCRKTNSAAAVTSHGTGATSRFCEHFSISSGRGCGWHHFSALSAPVLNFHAAYYSPETLTSGYDVLRRSFACGAESGMTAELVIGGEAGMKTTLVAVLPREPVSAEYAGKPVPVRKRTQHAFELDLPKASSGILRIR